MSKRTPARAIAQKLRTEKNKAKPQKKRKFASEEVKARKLKVKEIKRKRFLAKK